MRGNYDTRLRHFYLLSFPEFDVIVFLETVWRNLIHSKIFFLPDT